MEKALRYSSWLARYIHYTVRKNFNNSTKAASVYENWDVVLGSWVLTLRPRYLVASDKPPNETSSTDFTVYGYGSHSTVSSTQTAPQSTTPSLPSTATTQPGTTSTAGSLISAPDLRLVIGLPVVASFLVVTLMSTTCAWVCKREQKMSKLKRLKVEDQQDQDSIDSYDL